MTASIDPVVSALVRARAGEGAIAALDCDGTLLDYDIGEAALGVLVEDSVLPAAAAGFARPSFRPAIAALAHDLAAAGWEVWLVSAGTAWTAPVAAERLGGAIAPEHVLAAATRLRDGVITREVLEPVPVLQGKVTALAAATGGRRPVLAAGDGLPDVPLLEAAEHALCVDRPDREGLGAEARRRGWWVQPV